MPTGYTGLYIPRLDYRDPKWNEVMDKLGEAIRQEFLPSLGLRFDYQFERRSGHGYHPYGLTHLLSPHYADGWHVDDMKGEEGGVFVFGPWARGSEETKNMIIFCSFVLQRQVREFFEKLDKFVAEKLEELLPKKEPVQRAASESMWIDAEYMRMGRAFDFPQ